MGILGDLGTLITGYDDIGIMKNASRMNMFTVESTNNIVKSHCTALPVHHFDMTCHYKPTAQIQIGKSMLIGGLEHVLFSHILGIIVPIDELIFFRGIGIPPTSMNILPVSWLHVQRS